MSTTTLNIRIDSGLKREVDEVAKSLGLTSSAVFNVFAHKFVDYRGFPFEVRQTLPTEKEFTEEMDKRYEAMLKQ